MIWPIGVGASPRGRANHGAEVSSDRRFHTAVADPGGRVKIGQRHCFCASNESGIGASTDLLDSVAILPVPYAIEREADDVRSVGSEANWR